MPKNIVILGGGISGLSCAWFLKQKWGNEIRITLLEKSNRLGGWIQTIQHEGFLFEQGPRSCRTKGVGQGTLELVEQLGLQDQIIACDPSSQDRYLYCNRRLQKIPSNLWEFCRSSLFRRVIPGLLHDLFAPKTTQADETIHAFISRRFNTQIADLLIDPLVTGIFAGDARQLSIHSCFPLLSQWEANYRSLIWGALHHSASPASSPFVAQWRKYPIFSFKQGMETLVHRLVHRLEAEIRLNSPVNQLIATPDGVEIEVNGEKIMADHVISTLPAFTLASLFPSLSFLLNQVSYASVAVVNMGYDQPVLSHQGFGYLIPSKEKASILGCVWDSSVFPHQNQTSSETRLTVMMGGISRPDLTVHPEECLSLALNALDQHLHIKQAPQAVHVKIAHQAIPQYQVGYATLLQNIRGQLHQQMPHLTVIGTFDGVSVNDCIAQAKKCALRF